MSFTCPVCHMTSHHPKDEEEGYCGNCHDWTGDRLTAKRLAELAEEAERGYDPATITPLPPREERHE